MYMFLTESGCIFKLLHSNVYIGCFHFRLLIVFWLVEVMVLFSFVGCALIVLVLV